MKTYQDLTACGQDEAQRMEFVRAVVNDHKSSTLYKTAEMAEKYFDHENPTINRYEKLIYDMQGRAHVDMYTANHKIASGFFPFAVAQLNNYLLGNGITFTDEGTKKKLGRKTMTFDQQVKEAGKKAFWGGVSYGFWNLDHVEVFSVLEFADLKDEEDGFIKAGVRFWQIDPDKPQRFTLYELDGYTDYIQRKGEEMEVLHKKRKYKALIATSQVDGAEIITGENYPGFPIVPLKNNDKCRSEICGKRNTIDALDLVTSKMVNNVDEGNLIYWALVNCDGMDDLDDSAFIQRVKMTHVLHAEGDQGATAEPHSIEAPFEGTDTAIDRLEKRLFTDFQIFDVSAIIASDQTATAIRAMYVPMDLRTDDFETQVTKFIQGILALAGIEDDPSYTRNRIINTQEETQTVLMGAEYLPRDYIIRKLLTIWGDADMVQSILDQESAENLERFSGEQDLPDGEAETPTTGEAIEAAEEVVGKTLNGSQTSSLITVIKGLKSGDITEGQAVRILTTSIGVSREEALAIIRGD